MKLLSIALSFIFLISPAAAAKPTTQSQDSTVSLQLLWKHQFQFAGYYVAREKGFYREAGLDVEIREFDNGIDLVGDVLNGKSDFAVGRSSLLINKAAGDDIVALFATYQKSPLMLLSRADSDIEKPSDLKDRRIMLTTDAKEVAEIKAMMLQAGLREGDYIHQDHSFNLQDLIDDTTEAMGSYISNEPFQLQQQGIKYNILHPADYGFDMYADILFTARDFTRKHPSLTQKFMDASIKGWLYAFEHIEETADLILANYNSQNRSRDALIFEGQALRKLAFDARGHFGTLTQARFSAMANLYLVTGVINPNFDFSDFIYDPSELLLSANEQAYLKALGQVTLCANSDWMPYEGYGNGQHQGIVRDYMTLLSRRLKLDLEVIATGSWSEALSQIRSGHCDLIPGTMGTPYRNRYLKYSIPYLSMPAVIAVNSANSPKHDDVDLSRRRLAVVHDSAFYDILRNRYPNATLVPVNNVLDGLRRVETGNVYGLVDAPASISRALQNNHILDITIADVVQDQWDIGIAVRQDNERLLEVFNQAILSLTPEEHQTIANRWLNVRYAHEFDFRYLWYAAAVLGVLLILFGYRYKVVSDYNRRLEQLAQYDQLTGIYNRHKLYEYLEHELSLLSRYHRPSAIIFFDIDDFKSVNDTFGHNEGDRVLIGLSGLVSNTLRKSDHFGRWGGEEFLVVLPESTLDNAMVIAEKLRLSVHEHEFYLGERKLSCSFGVTEVRPGDTVESLISRVDDALYNAKHEGKNCVIKAGF